MTILQSPITDLNNLADRVSEHQAGHDNPAELQRLAAEVARLECIRADLESQIAGLRTELRASQASRTLLASDISRLATEKVCALLDKDEQLRTMQRKLDEWAVKGRRLQALEAIVSSIEDSASWRVTRPLRYLMALIRRVRRGSSARPDL